MNMLLPEEWCT